MLSLADDEGIFIASGNLERLVTDVAASGSDKLLGQKRQVGSQSYSRSRRPHRTGYVSVIPT